MTKMMLSLVFVAVGLSASTFAGGFEQLQQDIDACAAKGGGRVEVPSGRIEMKGTLHLRSNVELVLASDSELYFPDDPEMYEEALVLACGATNFTVRGGGMFRAKGDRWHREVYARKGKRPVFFRFRECGGIHLEDFKVRGSPMWTIHLLMSADIVMRGLDVFARGRNTDGVDVDSCENVLIENCRLDQGDDGFVMKSGKNEEGRLRGRPTRNVRIRNCTVVNGHSLLGIGSELSGGIEDVSLEDCTVEGEVWKVLYVKTNRERGGYARNISVRNVKCVRAKVCAFGIGTKYSGVKQPDESQRHLTTIENIRCENVVCDEGWYAVELEGDELCPARNIEIRNVEVKDAKRGYGTVRNIEGLVTENVVAGTGAFSVWCEEPDARYCCGQEAVFTLVAHTNAGIAKVRLDNFGDRVLFESKVDFSKQREFVFKGRRDIPGYLLATVSLGKDEKRCGVAFDRTRITAGAEKPADFEAFWKAAIADYDRKVPVDVRLERIAEQDTPGTMVHGISLSDPFGRRVYGYLRRPVDLSKAYPVRVHVPGAGPCVGKAEPGATNRIDLLMNVHYWKPINGAEKRGKEHNALQKDENDSWAAKYPVSGTVRYCLCGIAASREEYFYYGSILAAVRAVKWLRSLPETKDDDFTYLGGSQGGGMGLALMALDGGFRRGVVCVPAITAHLCHKIDERRSGWPRLVQSQLPENIAAAEANSRYFDGVNFASMITGPIVFAVGYIDMVAPPHAGYAAFNACPSKNKMMFDSVGYGHSLSKVESGEARRWIEGDAARETPIPISNCTLGDRSEDSEGQTPTKFELVDLRGRHVSNAMNAAVHAADGNWQLNVSGR